MAESDCEQSEKELAHPEEAVVTEIVNEDQTETTEEPRSEVEEIVIEDQTETTEEPRSEVEEIVIEEHASMNEEVETDVEVVESENVVEIDTTADILQPEEQPPQEASEQDIVTIIETDTSVETNIVVDDEFTQELDIDENLVVTEISKTPELPAVQESTTIEEVIGDENTKTAPTGRFELLNQARTVFQQGNTNEAIEHYRQLAVKYPNDPNINGELGNIYYSTGSWKQASQSYYDAAIGLHNRGLNKQLNYLHRVIQGLDSETAQKLIDQLDQ